MKRSHPFRLNPQNKNVGYLADLADESEYEHHISRQYIGASPHWDVGPGARTDHRRER